MKEIEYRKKRMNDAFEQFKHSDQLLISAAMKKEKDWQNFVLIRTEYEALDRAEFETSQASYKAAPPKGGLAASIEKVFGTEGLRLVERALREEELSKEPSI